MDGKASITIAEGQYKYGDEVIFQLYAPAGSAIFRERVNANYDRVQIFVKLNVFRTILQGINIHENKTNTPQEDNKESGQAVFPFNP